MWWLVFALVWWSGTSAIPSPGPQTPPPSEEWKCPEISEQPIVECSCDMPHTLRCTGDKSAFQIIARTLRSLQSASVSLLDCTVQNVSAISGPLLEDISLHGLVISSGEIREVNPHAFQGLASPLQALGLPNNQLTAVPTQALKYLPELDRLDLSGNKMKTIDGASFKGLRNLSFIDLSNNLLTKISPNTFDDELELKILRLRGNRLGLLVINKLNPLPTVDELDLSENLLMGPLGPKTFPKMDSLKDLQLSYNSLSSIKMGALQGLPNLTSLRLQHNLIDVIEDHAFIHLSSVVELDLAHNRIVAVSGASLAHLSRLTDLDLRHNFLRALTADLIHPLKSLKILKLDENDISIIASDAMKSTTIFKHFTLSENPLNCDCSLIEFSTWLNNSSLTRDDKSTAVCATPPSLENGLLTDIPNEHLVCGEDEQETLMAPLSTSPRAKISLQEFLYDGNDVKLIWSVDETTLPYSCDAIFVYEEIGLNEVLLESNSIKCNSSELEDPKRLEVTVPASLQLQNNHKYRYCVVLFASGNTDDISIVPGCSDMISLIQNAQYQQNYVGQATKIASIEANLSSQGSLSMDVVLYPQIKDCDLNVAILEQNTLLSQRKITCQEPRYTFVGLERGPYRVCANVLQPGPALDFVKPRCVTVFKEQVRRFSGLDVAFVSIFLVLCVLVIGLIWGVRRILLKPKIQTHQCFLPPECDDQIQHNRYVKLQATTKL
ncbi:leucine-rich repeats and immunoglobulin-like domains protein 1 [Cylas formicarius]|uniref:leucine-rich repeats and immunoglobulin-like domains protein 1 n=1 Tax=Cylas formicarius TaxID=197179 RepID=UPI002958B0A5|nr:leucine-rich repeats and immunoglobulin-like domains protein 1 [Cylas formicarius]